VDTGKTSRKLPKVKEVSEFLNRVRYIRDDCFKFPSDDPWEPWFRGHQNAAWELKPKLYRGRRGSVPLADKLRKAEDEIREEFIKRAPILCEALPAGYEVRAEWEWYFMMQHHKAATRLLDWTDGALIALYFAVKDNCEDNDAAVWVLDPYELNKPTIGMEWVIPPSATMLEPKYQRLLANWLPSRFPRKYSPLPPQVVAIEPTHVLRRMSSQHSCFTIHGGDPQALVELARNGSPCLSKIEIAKSQVNKIESELRRCGIDESTIYPDLDGLGASINARWGIREDGWRKNKKTTK